MLYQRIIENRITSNLFKGSIIVLYGPRQVGKTTLTKKIFNAYSGKKIFFRGDIPSERSIFKEPEPTKIIPYLQGATLVVIDEAQLIENIGVLLKVMYDTHPEIQFFVTGSSSFDLANKIREPLTGRALEYMLYPLSYEELHAVDGKLSMEQHFEARMNYGWYPKIVTADPVIRSEYLELLQNNTVYKDIFALENIKKPEILERLVIYLAHTIGSVVKIGSIARELKTTETTVRRYIQLLEKMFVIIKIPAYSGNPLNEIKNGYKIYFTDIGFRNSVIHNHTDFSIRNDKGAVFENYFIIERIKFLNNHNISVNTYFWQNYQQVEIDYIEEVNGTFSLYECKYSERKTNAFNLFKKDYSSVSFSTIITPQNYDQYILPE